MSLASLIAIDLPWSRPLPLSTGAGLASLVGKCDLLWSDAPVTPGTGTAGALPSLISMDLHLGNLYPVGLSGEPYLRQLIGKYAFGVSAVVEPPLPAFEPSFYIPQFRRRRR